MSVKGMNDNALRGERIESDDIVKFKVKKITLSTESQLLSIGFRCMVLPSRKGSQQKRQLC